MSALRVLIETSTRAETDVMPLVERLTWCEPRVRTVGETLVVDLEVKDGFDDLINGLIEISGRLSADIFVCLDDHDHHVQVEITDGAVDHHSLQNEWELPSAMGFHRGCEFPDGTYGDGAFEKFDLNSESWSRGTIRFPAEKTADDEHEFKKVDTAA